MELHALICFVSLLAAGKAQNCLQAAGNGGNLPDFGGPDRERIRNRHQAIVASYQFQCCGNVTEWEADVEPDGDGHQNQYDISFQVWRPSSNVMVDGCYNMVGQNRFTSISLSDGLVMETPAVSEQISFQPGDVVGFSVSTGRGDNDGIVLDTSYVSETVWFASVDAGVAVLNCPFPVGGGRFLGTSTNAAPVISVSYTTFDCPPSIMTSTPLTQPSPTSSMVVTSSLTMSPSPTPTPTVIGDGQLPRTVQPDQTRVSMATQPTTSSEVVDQTTSDSPPSVEQPTNNNIGLIIGVIVALILVMVIIALAIIAAGCFLRTRISNKRLSAPGSPSAVTNPNYDSGAILKKTVHYKPDSQMVILNGGDSSVMYDSVDSAYTTGMAHDYTYPTPSPTASDAKYTYISQKDSTQALNGHAVSKGLLDPSRYHAVGPDVGSNVYDEMQYADPDDAGKKFGYDARRSPKHQYQTLDVGPTFGEPDTVPVLYEDPTVSKYRKHDTGFFDSIGIYVPTEEQRVGLGNHYELSDNVPPTYNKLKFFIEDQVYWAPATTTSGLYEQLAAKKYREIPRNQIRMLEQLGSGQFGEVYKGMWTVSGATLELAIKTLKPTAPEEDKIKFLQESAIMGQFTHPNVVKLYGVVTVGDPVMICLELMTNGDLRSYLRNIDTKSTQRRNELQLLFLRFAKEIAAGMDYLARKSFVHRDLAARNVLLDDSLTCKIGDFGMARDLMDDTYYRSKGGKIPVKWTAPEALLYKKYSTDSDVWSYGMVLFEIWSVGRKPFSLHSNSQVLKLVQTGHCQPPPPGCPRSIYHLMVNCWNPEHQERPKFGEVFAYLQKPASQLIYWSELDSSTTYQAEVLGEELEYGLKLYVDLQEKYKQIYESV